MKEEKFSYTSTGGIKISAVKWLPEHEQCVAAVCLIHGLGEHSGRYYEMATKFCDHSIVVYACDLRGHGRSEGKRGHSASLENLLEDIQELIARCRRHYNDLPIVLLGHSMGGNLVANYLLRTVSGELSAAILSSPWLTLTNPPPIFLQKLSGILSKVAPALPFPSGLHAQYITSIEAEVQQYLTDPLNHTKITPSLFNIIAESAAYITQCGKSPGLPVLISHGRNDQITSHKASEAFCDSHESCHLLTFENSGHEPHHDVDKELMFEKYVSWVVGHVGNG